MPVTADTVRLLQRLFLNRAVVDTIFERFSLTEPRLFGSVARGTAGPGSDIDILVEAKDQDEHAAFMNLLGCIEELQTLLGVKVDVVAPVLAKPLVLDGARREGIPLWDAVFRSELPTSSKRSGV